MDNQTEKNIQNEQQQEQSMQAVGQEKEPSNSQALQQCQQEVAEWKDKYLRAAADFQNYKKRLEKDQANITKTIKADFLREILNIVDNFDRALEMKDQESQQEWLRGFAMIAKELYKFLQKHGISEIEETRTFNPELHEAVMQVESDTHQPGEIVEILQKGYYLNDEVLRPAKVSVAQ
jgi:molecular chaperone GrpE